MSANGVPFHWGDGFKDTVNFNAWDLYYFISQVAFIQTGSGTGNIPTEFQAFNQAVTSYAPAEGTPVQTGVNGGYIYEQW
jgi:hypothetical protein